MIGLVRYRIVSACWIVGLCLSFISQNLFAQNKELKYNKDYIDLVKYYRYLNPDSAIFYVKAGLKKADEENDLLGKAALLNQYGMIEDNASRYKESKEKYLSAEIIYRNEKNDIGLAATLIRLGVVEKRKGNYDKAMSYFVDALRISEKNKHQLGMLEGRVVFSEAYYSLGDYENALKNLQLAEAIDRKIPVSNFSLNMYVSYGYVYSALGMYDKAIYYTKLGLSKSNRVEFNGLKISLLKVLGIAYTKKGDSKNAAIVFNEALTLTRKVKNVLREQSTLIEISELYEKKQPDTALAYLKQALTIVGHHKMYRQQITVLNKMSELYKKKGDLARALALREQSNDLAEQIFYKDMMKQVANLEAAYNLEKSKVELSELTTKSKEQQSAKNVILAIAFGVFVVLVITTVYYWRSRRLNKLLTKANGKLEESNGVKDKLLSIIAHDIRSPLVSTVGIMRLINDKELDEDMQHEMVNKLMLHCNNSLEILDKLLKWGQMQIKGVRLNTSKFNPLPNIHNNLMLLKEVADQKKIKINIDVPNNILLDADSDHFDFIVRNLTANAIKFTNTNGEVDLKASVLDNNKIKFEVKDNGVGISKARIEKIFELSATGTKGTKLEEGTSLGLIICREFVLANQGELEVESFEGKGTIFSFTMKGFLKKIA